MGVGKSPLGVPQTTPSNNDAALDAVFSAIVALNIEHEATPGFATITASAAITKGQAVNINNKQLRPADASLGRPAIGVAVGGAAIGQKARIMLGMGYVSGLSGLTANSSVYLGNAGALLFTKPLVGMVQGIGFALSATELMVTIAQP